MYKDVIGVVGGMGSFATLHFFKQLLKAFPAEKEWDRPRILIDNRCTMPSRVLAVLEGKQYEKLVTELSDSIRHLLDAGATKIVLACNTSHCFLDEIYLKVPEAKGKIINIIEACCNDIKNDGVQKVGLIASEGTIETGVFTKVLQPLHIEVMVPEKDQYLKQRELIEAVKQDSITSNTLKEFRELIESFGLDSIILGCTEFPVLYEMIEKEMDVQVYDPLVSTIHILKKECK